MRSLMLFLAPLLTASVHASDDYQIQPVGQQHAWQALAEDGEHWLALVGDRRGYRLADARVEVEPVPGLFDPEEAEHLDGRMIAVPGLEPLMLMRGPGLVAGRVHSARRQLSGATPLADGDVLELHLAGDLPARLELACQQVHAEFDDLHDYGDHLCLLVFEQGARVQVLGQWIGRRANGPYEHHDQGPPPHPGAGPAAIVVEGGPALLFAGDLDGDGRIDLLLELSDHYNLSLPTLWLSGEGSDGEPLQEVAAYAQTGC